MSIGRVIVGLWRSYEGTSESPKYKELKTRYYKKSRDKLMEITKSTIEQKLPKWKISNIDMERGEMVLDIKKGGTPLMMVITFYKLQGMQSAVDVYCSKDGFLGDFGNSYKSIVEFFSVLHTEIQPENGR